MNYFLLFTNYKTPENIVRMIDEEKHEDIPNVSSPQGLPGLTIDTTVWDQIPSLQISRK